MAGFRQLLSRWVRDKMAAISQMTFSSGFPWVKTFEFWIKFHWTRHIWGIWKLWPALVIIFKIGFKSLIFFGLCNLEIWWMTSKNNRVPLLYYIKLCASFQSHRCIQTGVTVQKWSIWVKTGDIFAHMTLKFDGWPWKTIGHLFYATSNFDSLCIIS